MNKTRRRHKAKKGSKSIQRRPRCMLEPNKSRKGVESHIKPTKSARSIAIGVWINSSTNCRESDEARWIPDASKCYLGRLHTYVPDMEFPISVSLASLLQRTSPAGVAHATAALAAHSFPDPCNWPYSILLHVMSLISKSFSGANNAAGYAPPTLAVLPFYPSAYISIADTFTSISLVVIIQYHRNFSKWRY